jgi:hypothetical protein
MGDFAGIEGIEGGRLNLQKTSFVAFGLTASVNVPRRYSFPILFFKRMEYDRQATKEACMTDSKTCPKCNGAMTQGRIMKYNEFVFSKQYMYLWAPGGEPGPDLSKALSGKPQSSSRKGLAAFCCDQCGFVEFYGVAAG